LAANSAWAQDAVLDQMFGTAVESYYSGNYARAYNLLSASITAGSTDPRVYYFRGLSELFLGRSLDAQKDFRRGAQLESNDATMPYDVGRSLERVQGRVRLQLESYRTMARVEAARARDAQRARRYEVMRKAQPAAPVAAAAPGAEPGQPAMPAAAPAGNAPAANDPFAAPAATPPAANDPFAAPAEQKPAAKPADDPFGAPAAPATKPAEDPFGAPATPAAPADKKADDPFGS
jgi:hypothetical protein